MDIFSALADPTRRNIVELLASSGKLPAKAISNKFKISHPAISQHLKVLRQAELVEVEKRAQQRIYLINPAKINELEVWARKMKKHWEEKFAVLDKVLEEEKKKNL